MYCFQGWSVLGLMSFCHALNISVSDSSGVATSGLQYGLMFEDINYSADGGLYAELIQNRAFQGKQASAAGVAPWIPIGSVSLTVKTLREPLSSALPKSLNVLAENGRGPVGFANPGWWGIDVRVQKYSGSFYVRGDYSGKFTISLLSNTTQEVFGRIEIESKAISRDWTRHEFNLTPTKNASNTNNLFAITFEPKGDWEKSLDFNLISLFPPTYKNRPNGMRADIMEMFARMKPSFLRFPGGNNLQGHTPTYWKWHETIGPLKDRPGRPGTWRYHNTDGLGLIEYMHWCDDLNLEPILAVWAGYYLDGPAIEKSALGPYIQEALDELEFLTGPVSSKYGSMRAKLGYPKPWKIKYVEVGNEDNLGKGGASYKTYRFTEFYRAIKAKYPSILIFPSTVDYMKTLEGETGDYHKYARPDNFARMFEFFDNYPTNRSTLIGEYGVIQPNVPGNGGVDWSSSKTRLKFPNWIGTVGEAVFLLGAENNADKILGASYAPLLHNLHSSQWTPDLISFNSDPKQNVYSTSAHLVELFSTARFTHTLSTSADGKYGPMWWVAGKNDKLGVRFLKAAVYNSSTPVFVSVRFKAMSEKAKAKLTILSATTPLSFNEVGLNHVKKSETSVTQSSSGVFSFELPNYSAAVLEVK